MIRINLLPVRQIKKRIQSRNELIALLCFLLLVLTILGMVFLSLNSKVDSMNQEISKLSKEKEKHDAVLKRISKIKKDQAALETKLQVIQNLKTNSQLPVRVLDGIAYLTPPTRIWLESISLQGSKLTMNGIAMDNETIAQYMQSIKESPLFNAAELKSSRQADINGQKLKQFDMTVSIEKTSSALAAEALKAKAQSKGKKRGRR